MKNKTCFYAYSSHNVATSFTVQRAIELINSTSNEVRIIDWSSMPNSGKFIVPEICNEIDDAELFMCDLTDLNQNVLFELGYAIATRKRVWVTRQSNRNWRDLFYAELGLLETVGYVSYENYHQIADAFLKQVPFRDVDNTIYRQKIEPCKARIQEPKLLFLKSPVNSQNATSLSRLLMKSEFEQILVVDDPLETSNRSFEWYAENLLAAFTVISEFTTSTIDNKNAKYGFISGMAFGLGKFPLMIADESFEPPFDYRESMFVYKDIKERDTFITRWLANRRTQYDQSVTLYSRYQRKQQRLQERQALKNINLGEYEAELEREQLASYFVETDSFDLAMKNTTYIIFSGRKGSGKTANFLSLARRMGEMNDRKNFVCVIKPLAYDIIGVYQLYKSHLYGSVKMHVVESLWKYLIYTEIARDLREALDEKPEQLLSADEKHLISFVDNTSYIKEDFTIRLDRMIRDVKEKFIGTSATPAQQADQLSAIFHEKIIAQLRMILGGALFDREYVCILIDNLDKPWSKNEDLNALSLFLFGLLNVVERISVEFNVGGKRKSIPVSLTIFIRADILSVIKHHVPEADKLRITSINWNNEQRLLHLIEERFRSGLEEYEDSSEIWDKFFAITVDNMPTKKFLFRYVLPRPRDIIYFCKHALFSANSNQHTKIEADDLKEGKRAYSTHIYLTLIEEVSSLISDAPSLLRQFMNAPEIITKQHIEALIQNAGIDPASTAIIIDTLCEATFLGYEIIPDRFEFLYDDRKDDRKIQANRVIASTGKERYKINPPFHSYFEISSSAIE